MADQLTSFVMSFEISIPSCTGKAQFGLSAGTDSGQARPKRA